MSKVVYQRSIWLIACAAVVLGLVLRLHDLGLRSISHPEVYVPGILLPPSHVVPPPRLTWADTFRMHFHDEPHPMGWYWSMFIWTKLAGTSEWALRLPSALLGAATAWIAFLVGKRTYGGAAGALAAILIALHGLHIFWSQAARMYVAGSFFGLLSTYALLAFVYDGRRRLWSGAGYVLAVVATAECVEFVWPLLGVQILWAVLVLARKGGFGWSEFFRPRFAAAHPAIQLQALAVMLSAPELLHSAYRARPEAVEQDPLSFLGEYLGFGFAFSADSAPIPEVAIPTWATLAIVAFSVPLIARALRGPAERPLPVPEGGRVPVGLTVAVAVVMSASMVWLALIARQRTAILLVISAGPLIALWLPTFAGAADHLLSRSNFLSRWRGTVAGPRLLVALIAVAAPTVLFVLSGIIEILAPRAFLIFLPCLLVLAAGGVSGLAERGLRAAVGVALVAVFVASVPFSFHRPGSPRDYKTLVAGMRAQYRPDDLIFVLDKRWEEAPLFYYLPEARGVFTDYAAALQKSPDARIWLVTWPNPYVPVINDERREALAGYRRVAHVTALRASAELFVPPEPR